MRIVGGTAKSRFIFAPKSRDTRPMTDEARESLFNILGPIDGLRVLDAYAGSGAIGLEAISRGAAHVDGIEIAKEPANTIRRNLKALGFEDSYQVWQQSVGSWVKKHKERIGKYDLIFADPPFDQLRADILELLSQFLELTGLLIVKSNAHKPVPQLVGLQLKQSRTYGESSLTFYSF